MFRWFESLIDPFKPAREDRPPFELLSFYWRYVSQATWLFLAVLMTAGLLSVIAAALYAYVGVLIDRIEQVSEPAVFFSENGWLLVWIVVLVLVIEPLVAFAHVMLFNQAMVPAFTNLIRWQTHRYVLRQSVGFFQNDFAGRIANKVMQTSLALRRSVAEFIDAIWYVGIFIVTALVILAELDPRLALPLAGWLIAYVTALALLVPRIKAAATASSDSYSRLMGRVVDSYTNIQTVKLFGHARREEDYAREGIMEQNRRNAYMMRHLSAVDLGVGLLNGLLIVSLGGLALWLWSAGEITVGAVAAALGLAMRVTTMSHWIGFVATGIAENIGVVREGLDTISLPQAVTDAPAAPALAVPAGEIRFEGVRFRYGAAERQVVEDLSLAIAPGEKVGFVGPSGAGKTTLVNLLLRFHDLEAGRILIDGQDISGVTQESLRAAIGMVTQDTSLLHRSIRDNIRYGRPEASEEEILRAAALAEADRFIPELSDPKGRVGYDAYVGERGVKLSGGQRQRVAIARVILKDAPILVLDEATSALDSEVEAAIQSQLGRLMEGKTVIAIAHRLSTIAALDRLIVLDQGRIVEEGSHAELLERGGLYARLWARQSGGFLGVDQKISA